MIELLPQKSHSGKVKVPIHPEWDKWLEACVYSKEEARRELGMPRSTFYRQIKSLPTQQCRLAMSAVYEGLEPWVNSNSNNNHIKRTARER